MMGCLNTKWAREDARLTHSQIERYCRCVADAAASTLTYKQLGANQLDNAMRVSKAAEPTCARNALTD